MAELDLFEPGLFETGLFESGPISTCNCRSASINLDLGFGRVYPTPDGAFGQADRQQMGQKYPGFLVNPPGAFGVAGSAFRPVFRSRRR